MPSCISANAPKSVSWTILTSYSFPILNLSFMVSNGSGIIAFTDKLILIFSVSISRIFTFIFSPTVNMSLRFEILRCDTSLECNKQSRLSMLTKHP